MNKTVSFKAICGVNEGYDSACAEASVSLTDFAESLISAAVNVQAETGVYVSATVAPVRTTYSHDWGCPQGGERCYEIKGTLNPQFGEPEAYKNAVLKLCKKLKEQYKQSTLSVVFTESELEYLQ
jgi:hypothetical protein